MIPSRRAVVAGVSCAIVPVVAQAHLVDTGLGSLYDGIAHFGGSPEDYLPVVVLGFIAGLRGPAAARVMMAALSIGWLVGGAISMSGVAPVAILLTTLTAVLLAASGILLAWNPNVPVWVLMSIDGASGLVRGLDDLRGATPELAVAMVLGSICGCVVCAFALAASVTLSVKRFWMVVAVRAGGSWVAAIGVLLAGWLIRYGNGIR